MEKPVKLYPNESVRRVIAFVPPGHHHVRIIIELGDQIIVLHEAAVAGIVRAYAMTALHPTRRATELTSVKLGSRERKHGFAEHQLVETGRSEEEVLREALAVWERARPCQEGFL